MLRRRKQRVTVREFEQALLPAAEADSPDQLVRAAFRLGALDGFRARADGTPLRGVARDAYFRGRRWGHDWRRAAGKHKSATLKAWDEQRRPVADTPTQPAPASGSAGGSPSRQASGPAAPSPELAHRRAPAQPRRRTDR